MPPLSPKQIRNKALNEQAAAAATTTIAAAAAAAAAEAPKHACVWGSCMHRLAAAS